MVSIFSHLCLLLMLGLLPTYVSGLATPANDSEGNTRIIEVDQSGRLQISEDIGIQYSLSSRSIYMQQMLMIHYQLESNDAFISLRIDIEPRVGEEYVMLKTHRSVLAKTADRRYLYELNVLYNTSKSGEFDFRVPELIYSEGGRDVYRFRFASQPLVVNALPPYLPPYIPMGNIDMESSVSASSSWLDPLTTGRVYYWSITLKGKGISAQSMPDIRQQINSNRDIQFLPSDLSVITETAYDTLVQKMHYSIPFTLTSSGKVQLPGIRLQYFDVGKKRVVARSYVHDDLISMKPMLYWSIIIIVVAVPALLLWRIRHIIRRAYQNLCGLYHARRQLQKANTAQQVRMAMNKLGQAFGWQDNLPLQQWLHNWHLYMFRDQVVDEHVQLLIQHLYSAKKNRLDITGLRSALTSTCLRQCQLCIRASL